VLRVNTGGTFRPGKSVHYRPLREFVPEPGTQWVGVGTAFQGRRRLNCTLLARRETGYKDPWLLLTDLAPRLFLTIGYVLILCLSPTRELGGVRKEASHVPLRTC
jgi:hypothetical protein